MGQNQEYIAAIDIGTTKIAAFLARKTPTGKLDVLAIARTESHGVRRGMVLNIEETAADIEKVVNEIRKQSGIHFEEVFVGIAAEHIRCIKCRSYFDRDSGNDLITQEDVARLKREVSKTPIDSTEQILAVIPQHYIVDGESEIKNPVGYLGKRLEANFNLVVCKKVSAMNIERCLEMKGLKVKALMLEPLASSEAVITEEEKEMGVALIDIGGGTTDIAVFYNRELKHTAVIPFGGFVITRDIKEGCGILQKHAEELKLKYGSAFGDLADPNKVVVLNTAPGREQREISFRTLAQIIQARMTEIIDMAMFEVENSGFEDKLNGGIVITGGGALLQHLPQLFNYKTGMETHVGYPGRYLGENSPEHLNDPIYSTGIGLLLQGFQWLEDSVQDMEKTAEKGRNPVVSTERINSEISKDEMGEEREPTEAVSDSNRDRKNNFLESLRKTIGKIFDDKDDQYLN